MSGLKNLSLAFAGLTLMTGLVAAPQAQAATFAYTGTTVGSPVWNRPLAGTPPNGLSGVGTATPFSFQPFFVNLSGSYTFLSLGVTPTNWDNYTFLYQNTFSPTAQLTNALTGNDDNPTIGRSGFTFNLTAGTQYFFVTTGFANTDTGIFNNTITGPGNIFAGSPSAVPEPASMAGMLAFGAVGVATRLRRQKTKV
ncbi:PEP-CTERM sorting domain-containing protein [Anthocerotibacter panamensis]|uniref:PEP-CTERM sorting domain-containing protein n=1 Tax=Anthocerotibacter panamensis TaxID=2857077 RepID=UPI001C403EFD|nr:PEP-CTERM sorting domain-containing protein [Anthocerotibacter panamensis]